VRSVNRFLATLSARPELFGVVDYGLSSLATFLVGIYAARTLDPVGLGVYALCFRAVFLGGIVPSHWVFLPAENLVVSLPLGQRLSLMRHTLRRGARTALASALGVTLWVLLAPPSVSRGALTALTATGIAAAFFSPIQDHVRRMLHLSGASGVAAVVSTVQLLAVAGAILFCNIAGVATWWVPLGALAFANLASLSVGVRHASLSQIPTGAPAVLRPEEIRRSGRWLVLLGLLDAGAIFLVAAVVARVAGPAALGYAEAARIAANPVLVLAWGLSAVLGPRSVRAGRELNAEHARQISGRFAAILAAAGAASLAIFTVNWWGNPMAWLLPTAYVIPGLAGLSILAYLAYGFGYPFWSELIGGRLERSIAKTEIRANVLRTVLAASAAFTHAYAVPLSLLGFSLARWFGLHRMRITMYGRGTSEAASLL
jgi:O-antigen/teichoic acid export membrane protein